MKKFLLTTVAILFAVMSSYAQFSNSSKSKSSGGGDIEWRGDINVGLAMGKLKNDNGKSDKSFYAPFITANYGSQLNEYFYVGAGAGFKYLTGKITSDISMNAALLPIFVDLKAFYPVSDDLAPFIMLDLGYSIGLSSKIKYDDDSGYYIGMREETDAKINGGFLMKAGVGVQYTKFTLGLGYEMQKLNSDFKDISHNAFFFSLGYAF